MSDLHPDDLGSMLMALDANAKHFRLETGKWGERRIYRFALWTKDSRRVAGYGRSPVDAVNDAMVKLRAGKSKPSTAKDRPAVEQENGDEV